MDSDEISKILARENSQSLNQVPADFYQEAAKYVRKLETEILKINNRRSSESKLLEDEAERAVSDLETLFMKRIKKVVIRAKNQAQARSERPIAKDLEKMLPVEKRLYELVLEGIEAAKTEMLGPVLNPESAEQPVSWPQPAGNTKEGRSQNQPPLRSQDLFQDQNPFRNQTLSKGQARSPQPGKRDTGEGTGIGNAEKTGRAEKPGAAEKTGRATGTGRAETVKTRENVEVVSGKNDISKDFVLVRILKDLPTFTGADGRNYTVKTEDVVVLPQMNATVLLKRKAAKLIS